MDRGVDERLCAIAASVRGWHTTPVDPFTLALEWEVDVAPRALTRTLWGARLPSGRVVINQNLRLEQQRLALAHELGHVWLARHDLPWVLPAAEESFCDRFAWELLAPLAELHDYDLDHLGSGERFGVDDGVVQSQLVASGLGPPVYKSPLGIVICWRCGEVQRYPSCPCGRYRSVAA